MNFVVVLIVLVGAVALMLALASDPKSKAGRVLRREKEEAAPDLPAKRRQSTESNTKTLKKEAEEQPQSSLRIPPPPDPRIEAIPPKNDGIFKR